ncbi:TonB-dependent receptor [Croceicoccus estronivorus]|uniref:TonB-dependent receptor domain-containing protein n=1 Tax=Croceicoccus estronivorus TaxID=1172626 RepID=UPI000829B2FB|nr:TonB-dependent receptor [Croceicoccus estronivorus]OCC22574.1 TonB-dependent receptor [Croceicoccus estronivorus]
MTDFCTTFNARLSAGAGIFAMGMALCGTSASAEEGAALSAEEERRAIVVTASGFEQKITDAPASITVVTAEEIRQRPYTTMIDAVRDLEGVDVGETSDKTGQRTISIRGMGSDYTLVLIDGKRQNNHGDIYPNNFGGNQFNHIPPLDTIERVEVIRGPASTLYGADALGGVINIITKKVMDRWTGSATFGRSLQEDSSFGDDMTFDIAASGPIIPGILGLSLRGSIYERLASNPEYAPAVDPDGGVHIRSLGFGGGGKTVDNTNKSVGFSLNWTPSDRHSVTFDYDISKQKYDNKPDYDPETGTSSYPLGTVDSIERIWLARGGVVGPRTGYAEQQKFDRMNWALTHQGEWGRVKSFLSLAYVETKNKGRTLPFSVAERVALQGLWDAACIAGGGAAGCGNASIDDLTDGQYAELEAFLPRPDRPLESNQYTLDARLDIPVDGVLGNHRFVVGGQYIDGEMLDGVFGMEGSAEGLKALQKQKMWSLFAEDNWSPVDALTITGGIRYDNHDAFGGRISPRLYAVYELSPSWTVKGGLSTGYKTPKTTDLYEGITGFGGQGTSPWTGNPDLEPETSTNMEAALYWTAPSGRHNFNVTAFQNDFKNKIVRTPVTQTCAETGGVRPCANLGAYWEILGVGSLNQPINIDKARIRGLEVAGRYEFFDGLSLRLNYTLTDSEQLSGVDEGLPLTNSAKHMANATLGWNVTEKLSAQLMGELRSKRYRGVDTLSGEQLYYKSYKVLHLGAQYRLNDHVTISGRVNNLLDQDFTSYRTIFVDDGFGGWEPSYQDDYNNKDKARSYWISVSARF